MDPAASRSPVISINNSGNVTGSFNNYNISAHDEKHRVLEWLSPSTSRERHKAVRDARVDGVGDWLLHSERFSAWHTLEDEAAKPVLLCHGGPGVGKTYASSLVIDTLSDETRRGDSAVAFVYCDFNSQNLQCASTLLRSVLRQVVAAMVETPDDVLSAFDHAGGEPDGRRLRLPEILNMLAKSLLGLNRSFVCIDALDEFPQNQRPELLQSLQRLILECPQIRLFLTGRPYIIEEVRRCFTGAVEMLQISPRAYDIGLYLRMRLDRDPGFDAMDEGLRADIIRVIPERISGMFLLVCLVVDAILAETTIYQRRQALYTMTNGHGLQNAYDTTMDRIRRQGGNRARLGMEALMWVSHCQRPLKAQELCHALGVELGAEDFNVDNVPTIRAVLGCALGLVTVGEGDSTVRLLHLTLREYLHQHHTAFVSAQSIMAEICLTYLNSELVRASNLDSIRPTPPFLEYAACFWGTHVAGEVSPSLKSLVLRLLDGYENHVSATVFWRKKLCGWDQSMDVHGISGLHCIAFWGIEEIASAMLGAKMWDVNRQNSEGGTPLSWAVKYGNDRVAELFLRQGDIEPDRIIRSGRTVLSFASELGNERVVTLLLERGDVNPDLPDNDGRTPLSYAAERRFKGVWFVQLKRCTRYLTIFKSLRLYN